jgi:uncharacterized membrane protein YgdD (TMEM256/DUF423 family)
MWIIMLITAITACVGVHLGLFGAIASVISKIASCERCSCFWLTVIALTYYGADVIAVVALSMLAAYLSSWIGVSLIWLNKIYDRLWEKLNK